MLKIRPEQMRIFDELRKQAFVEQVAREIASECPEEVDGLSEIDLRKAVASGFERAAAYGFEEKYSFAMFAKLLFLASRDFDRYPKARFVLNHPSIPPDRRIDRLIELMRDRDWEDVRVRAGKAAR